MKKLTTFSDNLSDFIQIYFGVMAGAISYYLLAALAMYISYKGYKMAKENGATGFPFDTDFSKRFRRKRNTSLQPVFQPSETFQGPFPGYVYKQGDKGLGYYPDKDGIVESMDNAYDSRRLFVGKLLFYIFGSVAFILLLPIIINYVVLFLTSAAFDEL
jgi:hypothetical protein|tara:strand:- start:124 stop:600 length:477 start_codon:yes stop_codon:yes gene_type:complete